MRRVCGWGSRKYSALEGYGNQSCPIRFSIFTWGTPSLTEKPGRPQSTGLLRVGHDRSDPALTALPQGELRVKVARSLACRDPGRAKCAGTRRASTTAVMALSESFFKPLVAGDQRASLASLSL